MALTAPPDIPLITDPSTFATRAQDWVVWQADSLYPFLEDGASVLGLSTSATSTTSNTIGTGSKSFTVQTDKGFIVGMSLSIARTSAPTNRMLAVVTSYNSGTGALVVTSQAFEGSGTYTDWSIAQSFAPFMGGTFTTDLVMSSASLQLSKGADVASAATLPLITDGNYFDVTGTTSITSFASMGVGTQIVLHFDGVLTLTHHATDLILPSGANITTAAGDEAGFIEYASGDWRCVWYTRANGTPLINGITSGTAIATTSGTVHQFTALPSSIKRISFCLNGVSTSGTSLLQIQLGTSSGYQITNYFVASMRTNSNAINANSTTTGFGFPGAVNAATYVAHGLITFMHMGNNVWVASGGGYVATDAYFTVAGSVTLSDVLTQIRLTTVNGTDTFDAGSINILYE